MNSKSRICTEYRKEKIQWSNLPLKQFFFDKTDFVALIKLQDQHLISRMLPNQNKKFQSNKKDAADTFKCRLLNNDWNVMRPSDERFMAHCVAVINCCTIRLCSRGDVGFFATACVLRFDFSPRTAIACD